MESTNDPVIPSLATQKGIKSLPKMNANSKKSSTPVHKMGQGANTGSQRKSMPTENAIENQTMPEAQYPPEGVACSGAETGTNLNLGIPGIPKVENGIFDQNEHLTDFQSLNAAEIQEIKLSIVVPIAADCTVGGNPCNCTFPEDLNTPFKFGQQSSSDVPDLEKIKQEDSVWPDPLDIDSDGFDFWALK